MNRILGGGLIIKKEGWLVSIQWKTTNRLPIVRIKKVADSPIQEQLPTS